MNTYNVTLMVAGVGEEHLDGIYEATDGAANVEVGDRWTSTVGFDIEADTFADAILQAIDQIEQVPGLTVVRVEPDQLVWASEIADRIGRTRQSIDQLVKGQRGPGGFPAPVSGNVRNPIWRWADVEAWFAAYEHREIDTERPAVIGAINGALEARRNLHVQPNPELAARLQALIGA
ncbi:MAG: helix-turn-helix transcriptional regulator [Acidimicrobiales bacterium]